MYNFHAKVIAHLTKSHCVLVDVVIDGKASTVMKACHMLPVSMKLVKRRLGNACVKKNCEDLCPIEVNSSSHEYCRGLKIKRTHLKLNFK